MTCPRLLGLWLAVPALTLLAGQLRPRGARGSRGRARLIVVLPPSKVIDLLIQRQESLLGQAELAFIQRLRQRIESEDPSLGWFWRQFHVFRTSDRT